jgi:hypothetical protein
MGRIRGQAYYIIYTIYLHIDLTPCPLSKGEGRTHGSKIVAM